jgi:hypothetical protein
MGYVINPFWGENLPLTEGLVAWYTMDEGSNLQRDDSTANALHLDDNNGVNQSTGGLAKVGACMQVTGINNEWLDRPSSDAILNFSGSFTICTWALMVIASEDNTLVCKHGGAGQIGYTIQANGSGSDSKIRFIVSDDGTATTEALWGSTWSTSTWYFIHAYYDSVAGEIGVNVDQGTPITKSFTGPIHASTAALTFGARAGGALPRGSHRTDETGIWSRVLSAQNVADVWNDGNGITYPG